MAFKPGYIASLFLDNAAGTLTNLSPYIDSTDFPQNVDTVEVSAFGTQAKAYIGGLSDGDTVSFSGPYDVTLHTHITAVKAAQAAGTASFSYQWGPGGSVSGQAKVTGECLLAGYSLSSGVGGRAEYTCSLQVTGAVTNGTF